MRAGTTAISAAGLHKAYGKGKDGKAALDGLDLEVPAGTVCGVLGPNGAGKTTAVRVLTTLLRHDSGEARVAGYDVRTQPDEVRAHIGLVGQHTAVDEVLSGRQNLELFGRLFQLGGSDARRRADELLEQVGLADVGRKPAKQYSGGMRRRLDLAASLVLAPDVLFLDEPTAGLDPRGRNEVWQAVRELVCAGTTVLLTTQYLEEADRLADRVAVIDDGRVIAEGTPEQLKQATGGDRIEVVCRDTADLAAVTALVRSVGPGTSTDEVTVDDQERRVSGPVVDRVDALTRVMRALDEHSITAEDVALRRPTLDEVFLHLTGRSRTAEVAA